MPADPGGARLIKDDKKLLTTRKLKDSELSTIFIVAIIAVAALGIYFVLFPMFTNMNDLTDDIDSLRAQEYEYRAQISQTESYLEQYKEAQADYNRFFSYFYSPMDPEIIDERITSMLIAHDMTPASLSMTTLNVEGVSPYFASELRVNPVPDLTGADGDGQITPVPPIGDISGEDVNVGDYFPDQEQPDFADSYAFVYTVNVSAYGNRDNLYTFLAQVAPMTAMIVTAFDFTDSVSEKGSDGKTITTPGQINMEIKMYVLIDGVPARDFGTGGL